MEEFNEHVKALTRKGADGISGLVAIVRQSGKCADFSPVSK
jgi:hypothetical protein